MEYFIGALKKYADFTGRARRKECWMFALFYFIFYVVAAVVDGVFGSMIFTTVYSLALFIPCLSMNARRLHDTGRTGWWQLILLVPLVGAIVMLIFLVQDGHEENQYGLNPKFA